VDSDHHLIEVWIKRSEQEGKEGGKGRESRNRKDVYGMRRDLKNLK